MPERLQSTTRFMSGQNSGTHEKAGEKIKVKTNMSKSRNIGQPDPLAKALATPMRELPSGSQPFAKRAVDPKGHKYTPAGFNGKPSIGSGSKTLATALSGHTSAPGKNAVGNNSNRRGQKSGYPNGGKHA